MQYQAGVSPFCMVLVVLVFSADTRERLGELGVFGKVVGDHGHRFKLVMK